MKLTLTLPLPPKECSPNHTVGSRGGRMAKARVVKQYRAECRFLACCFLREQGVTPPKAAEATCRAAFFFKTARFPDRSNAAASIKSTEDGALTDAGIVADDSGVTWLPVLLAKDAQNPRVELTVWIDERADNA